jgi:hypothetical protein
MNQSYEGTILGALRPKVSTGNLYGETADDKKVARRRAKNKAARKARRVGRR